MEVAKEQAVREQLAQALREEAGRWQEVAALSAYCTALEGRIRELDGVADASAAGEREGQGRGVPGGVGRRGGRIGRRAQVPL